jgi:hypothetical protein
LLEAQGRINVGKGIAKQRRPARGDRQRAAGPGLVQAEVQFLLAFDQALARRRPQISTCSGVCAEPTCSISREPRREDQTICTAAAPEPVVTVRTYVTTALYGPRAAELVRKSLPSRR